MQTQAGDCTEHSACTMLSARFFQQDFILHILMFLSGCVAYQLTGEQQFI